MGNCCSAEHSRAAEEQIFIMEQDRGAAPPTRLKGPLKTHAAAAPSPPETNGASAAWTRKVEESTVPVLLLLATGMGIECEMKYDRPRQVVSLSRDDNYREIALAQVKKVLHTPEELAKIQIQQAAPAQDSSCSALLLSSGHCITLRFDSASDCRAFVTLMVSEVGR